MKRTLVQGKPYYRIEATAIKAELPHLLPASSAVQALTGHWTAGAYDMGFADYQVLIADGYILVSEQLLNWSRHQHTWRRNTGNIGFSFMAMANATERNAGHYPVTKGMIERAALVVALLVRRYGLGWGQVYDHADWAAEDGYKGQRWDNRWPVPWEGGELLSDVVLRKAKWYYEKAKPGP